MRIVLLGLPGSGKGTQGKKLSEVLGIPHISIGDCVREILKTDTPLAKEIRDFHSDKWKPLPDSLANKIFQEFSQVDCIVDGFPRNVEQLKVFDPQVDDRFIYLEISEKESCDRVLKRNRSDDALLFWQARMEVERSRLPKLIQASDASIISAEGDIENILQLILQDIFYEPWRVEMSETDAIYSPYCSGIGGDSPIVVQIGDRYFLPPTQEKCPEFWNLFNQYGFPKLRRFPPEWLEIKTKVLKSFPEEV